MHCEANLKILGHVPLRMFRFIYMYISTNILICEMQELSSLRKVEKQTDYLLLHKFPVIVSSECWALVSTAGTGRETQREERLREVTDLGRVTRVESDIATRSSKPPLSTNNTRHPSL